MSRSKKKIAIVKDKNNHHWYNRIFRRVNRQRIRKNKRPFLMNEIIDKYDVCDYILYYDNDEDKKDTVKRK